MRHSLNACSTMRDEYATYDEMARHQRENVDFVVEWEVREASAAVLAIHGGPIERHTDLIARSLARDDLSYYVLIGKRAAENKRYLHIASERFEEPRALRVLQSATAVVAIHGEANETELYVMPGGCDLSLRNSISVHLEAADFETRTAPPHLSGKDPSNICNRGKTRQGVQLEISMALRTVLAYDAETLRRFSDSVRAVLVGAGSGNDV